MKIRELLRNEIVQTIILIAITVVGVAAFWFGLRFAFQTEFPLLAVASGSMEPTLYRGDLIIVQGVSNFSELHVGTYKFLNGTLNPNPGEAIVYYDPRYGKVPVYLPVAGNARLIVHRAIDKQQADNGTWYFTTAGDKYGTKDTWSPFLQDYIVGRVIGKVPWLGHVPLFLHENRILATSIIVLLFATLIIVDFLSSRREDEKTKVKEEKQ
ncbi:MAG: hypothetical protein JSV57_06140 [Candidatus Bathyarchaeota archaeon]|nr:MAG: hypothetical protein JSV57_06140 [Candidatus Bathyarchaeota archaeon]